MLIVNEIEILDVAGAWVVNVCEREKEGDLPRVIVPEGSTV